MPHFQWGSVPAIGLVAAVAFALAAYSEPAKFASSAFSSSSSPLASNASTYCYRGVRTHDRDNPYAHCFAVVDGTFARVWSDDNVDEQTLNSSCHTAQQPKLLDGYVIPGLWDGHGHLGAWGEFLHSVDIFNATTIADVRLRLKTYLKANPLSGTDKFWLRGTGWDQDLYGHMPTAADLDEDPDLKGVYVMLDRNDGHCIWVSQAVLDLLPANATASDPPGGQVIRSPGLGVFCDNAMNPVSSLLPPISDEIRPGLVRDAMRDLNKVGLVGVHDASTRPDDIKLYNELANDDRNWTVRVYSMMECDNTNSWCPDNATRIARKDSRFWVQSVKLFADGALGSRGSALLEPYTDKTNSTGSLLLNDTTMTSLTKTWAEAGFQVNVHAIGDRANRQVIDAFIAALIHVCPEADTHSNSTSDYNYEALRICQLKHRFRVEHAQIVHPDDQHRLLQIGIIASVQPTHPTDDMRYAQLRLGDDRTDHSAYRMRSYLSNLAPVILGSDFPVEPPNPFRGIYAAVTRKNPATGLGLNGSTEGWHAEESLTLDQALWGFTGATAYGAFLDGRAGLIRQGAFADWVVLDRPIEEIPIEEFRNLTVRETWVAGKRVYARDDSAGA